MVEHISSTDPDFFLIDTETEDINKKCILIGTYDQVFREYEFLADLTPGKYMIIHYEDLDPEEKELWTAS